MSDIEEAIKTAQRYYDESSEIVKGFIDKLRELCGNDNTILADIQNYVCLNNEYSNEIINQDMIGKTNSVFTAVSGYLKQIETASLGYKNGQLESNSCVVVQQNEEEVKKQKCEKKPLMNDIECEVTREEVEKMMKENGLEISLYEQELNKMFPNEKVTLTSSSESNECSSKFYRFVHMHCKTSSEESKEFAEYRAIIISIVVAAVIGFITIPVVNKIRSDNRIKNIANRVNANERMQRMSQETMGMVGFVASNINVIRRDFVNNRARIIADINVRRRLYKMIIAYTATRNYIYSLENRITDLKIQIDQEVPGCNKKELYKLSDLRDKFEKIKTSLQKKLTNGGLNPNDAGAMLRENLNFDIRVQAPGAGNGFNGQDQQQVQQQVQQRVPQQVQQVQQIHQQNGFIVQQGMFHVGGNRLIPALGNVQQNNQQNDQQNDQRNVQMIDQMEQRLIGPDPRDFRDYTANQLQAKVNRDIATLTTKLLNIINENLEQDVRIQEYEEALKELAKEKKVNFIKGYIINKKYNKMCKKVKEEITRDIL